MGGGNLRVMLIFYIMAERKSLSKKIRFEVFKRDSFTCQYCGAKAPDVVLEADHINPVKNGGDNGIMNLITSCYACNRGKSARKLNDGSIVEKQREQIAELNLRRQQLEMMLEWRDGLRSIKDDSNKKAIDYYNGLWKNNHLSEVGEKRLIALIEKFGLLNVLEAIDTSYNKYSFSKDESKAFNDVFNKLGGILFLQNAPEYKKEIAYIKGICRNNFAYINEKVLSIKLEQFYKAGYDLNDLKEELQSGNIDNWTELNQYLNDDGI
jgi:hypothetical protein